MNKTSTAIAAWVIATSLSVPVTSYANGELSQLFQQAVSSCLGETEWKTRDNTASCTRAYNQGKQLGYDHRMAWTYPIERTQLLTLALSSMDRMPIESLHPYLNAFVEWYYRKSLQDNIPEEL